MRKFIDFVKKQNVWLILLTLAMAVFGVTDVNAMGAMAVGVAGIDGAAEHIQGSPLSTDNVNEFSPTLNRPTIDERITKIFPGITPIDQITRLAGRKKKASSMDFKFYSADTRAINDVVTSAYTQSGSSVNGYLSVGNPDLFNVSDTIHVKGVKGYDATGVTITTSDIALIVLGKDSSSPQKLQVMAVNGVLVSSKITVPSIPLNTNIYRLGSAAIEGDIRTTATNAIPTPTINYCQIFKVEVSETTIEKLTVKEVNWDISDAEEIAFYDFRRGIESSGVFGIKGKSFNSVANANQYTTGGIYWQIPKYFEIPSEPTLGSLIDMAKYVFTGQSGSRKKLLLMGSEFNAGISKINSVMKQIDAKNTEVKWGIDWTVINTNFGEFYGIHYDLLDQYDRSDEALVIDPDYIDKWVLMELGTLDVDTKKTGIFDGDVRVTTEISGFALRYPNAHCRVKLAAVTEVTGITTSAATHALSIGATYNFAATNTIAPSEATNTDVVYVSSAPSKATVNSAGLVTGIAAGTAVISSTTVDGNFTVVCTVTVS